MDRICLFLALTATLTFLGCQQSASPSQGTTAGPTITVAPLLSGYQLTATFGSAKAADGVVWSSATPDVVTINSVSDLDGQVSSLAGKAAILTTNGVLTPIGGTTSNSVTVTATEGSQSVTKTIDLDVISYASRAGRAWLVTSETVGGTTYTTYDATNAPDVGVTYTIYGLTPADTTLSSVWGDDNYGWYPTLPRETDGSHGLVWVSDDTQETVTAGQAGPILATHRWPTGSTPAT